VDVLVGDRSSPAAKLSSWEEYGVRITALASGTEAGVN
jgi:hypothetical protein